MVGIDDSRSGSDDNVVYVWSYVSVEYTIKRIITRESRHGLYNSLQSNAIKCKTRW